MSCGIHGCAASSLRSGPCDGVSSLTDGGRS